MHNFPATTNWLNLLIDTTAELVVLIKLVVNTEVFAETRTDS